MTVTHYIFHCCGLTVSPEGLTERVHMLEHNCVGGIPCMGIAVAASPDLIHPEKHQGCQCVTCIDGECSCNKKCKDACLCTCMVQNDPYIP